MIISVAVHGSPTAGGAVRSALHFTSAALDAGHQIRRVFFYHDAVHLAQALAVPPQDERPPLQDWLVLRERHGHEFSVCIAAALRRGVLNDEEAQRYERATASLHEAFDIVGLGQLIDAIMMSDRFVTFPA